MAILNYEKGFTRVPNKAFDHLIKYRLSGLQKDIVWCIIRRTYGYNKIEAKLSLRFIAKRINSTHVRVSEALKVLIEKNIVKITKDNSRHGQARIIKLNADYDTWSNSNEIFGAEEFENLELISPELSTSLSPEEGNNINTDNKEKIKNAQEFEQFWNEYPRKVAKKKAQTLFAKLKLGEELFSKIMAALRAQKLSSQWQNPTYIPHPTTWLSQERWNDEFTDLRENVEECQRFLFETNSITNSYVQKQLSLMEENHAE